MPPDMIEADSLRVGISINSFGLAIGVFGLFYTKFFIQKSQGNFLHAPECGKNAATRHSIPGAGMG
jgi:hypothetical protein